MRIAVLIEPRPEGGLVASGFSLGLTAYGPTEDEALAALESLLRDRLRAGARVVALEVPVGTL